MFVLSPCKGKEIIHQTQTLSGRVLNENEVLSLFENQSNYKKDNAYVFFFLTNINAEYITTTNLKIRVNII